MKRNYHYVIIVALAVAVLNNGCGTGGTTSRAAREVAPSQSSESVMAEKRLAWTFMYPSIENLRINMSASAVAREAMRLRYQEAPTSKNTLVDATLQTQEDILSVELLKTEDGTDYKLEVSFLKGRLVGISLLIRGNELGLGERMVYIEEYMKNQNIPREKGEYWSYKVKRWNLSYTTLFKRIDKDNVSFWVHINDFNYYMASEPNGGGARRIL